MGGFRAGTVDDIDQAFVELVEVALVENRDVRVVAAPNCPPGFLDRLAEIGVVVEVDESLDRQAFLVDEDGHLTSA